MKLAFIANYEKTIYFHGIATRLATAGHEVFWISPSGHWTRWLVEQGCAPEHVLDLSRFGPQWHQRAASNDERRALAAIEERSGLRFNDVILMDRILRDRDPDEVYAYLAVNAQAIEQFLTAHDIRVVFGEQTFGVEILTGMLCRAQGRRLLMPHVVRIPTGCLGFFSGHLQAELFAFRTVAAAHRERAARFLDDFREKRPRPDYFHKHDKRPMPRASWPAKLAKHVRLQREDPFDATHFSPGWLVRKRGAEVVNAFAHRLEHLFWVPPTPPERPFILFPLHRQPEASIDVLGSRTSNQLELVAALARTLPATHDLYVKEHPNGLGDRAPNVLRAFRAIPGVRLVDPGVSSFALVDAADLVVTLSGTTAYEAALLGRPAVAIADMYFGPILSANHFNPYERSLGELLKQPRIASDEEVVAFLANVIAQSFPGRIDNPLFTPEVLDVANLDAAGQAFHELLSSGRC